VFGGDRHALNGNFLLVNQPCLNNMGPAAEHQNQGERETASNGLTKSNPAHQKRPNLSITTKNLRGFSGENSIGKRDEIAHSMKEHNVDVACLQETWTSEDEVLLIHGHQFILHGGPSNRGGVGLVLSPKAIKAWERAGQPDPIKSGNVAERERTISIELHFLDGARQIVKYFVVSSYAPCAEHYTAEDYSDYLLNLEEKILQKCPVGAIPIIGIDANATISDVRTDDHGERSLRPTDIVGKFGVRQPHERGDQFMNFLSENGLCSTGSYFSKKCHFTHMDRSGNRREVDHILLPRRHLRCLMRFDIIGGVESDHTLLRIKLRIAAFIPKKQAQEKEPAELSEEAIKKKRTSRGRHKSKQARGL
jgi:hypothetical protein